jgi:SSS family solute:Na+ symporter
LTFFGRVLAMLPLMVAAAMSLAARPALAASPSSRVTPELRERSAGILRQVFEGEQRWLKVHAAEYLLALDHPEGVKEAFTKELQDHGGEPQYRIGIWRVLARAAYNEKERQEQTKKIRDAFFDTASPDRLHAAETLAKLGYVLPDDEVAGMEQAAGPENGPWAPYAAWILLNSGRPGSEARLAAMLDSDDAEVRLGAAYALGHRPSVSEATRKALAAAAQREPADSKARVFLLFAAAAHAPAAENSLLKNELAALAAKGGAEARNEACRALTRIGDPSDLALLTPLLDDPDPDLRATAADAVLRIDRRVPHRLGLLDWAVIAVYALGMLSVGWYYSRRTTTQEEYLLGGRRMSPLMVGISFFASLFSCISYLAWPGEIIKFGPMILGAILAYPLIGLVVGWLMIPFIMRLKITSAYEILELRFGPAVRTLGSLLFLSLRLMWMSVIIYAMATKVLVPLSGLPHWTIPIVCAALVFVTMVYTAMGGLRAVVITDVLQAFILFGAAIVTLVAVTIYLGGVGAWWPSHWLAHWPEPKFGYDPTQRVTLFAIVLANFTWYVCTSASDQIAVQRYLSTRDAKAARTVLFSSLVADTIVTLILAAVGFAVLAYFQMYPHLLSDGQTALADADKLFPQFIIVGLPVGLSGLVVAGLLACAMSALSAGINSTCSVFTVDILDRLRGKNQAAEAGRVGQLRYVSFFIGAVVVALSLFVNMVQGNLLEICYKVVNLLTAPLAGLFFLAMFVPWARAFGALVGAACGLVVVVAISYWKELAGVPGIDLLKETTGLPDEISFLWAMPLSLVVEFVVGALVSLLPIGRKPKPLNEII